MNPSPTSTRQTDLQRKVWHLEQWIGKQPKELNSWWHTSWLEYVWNFLIGTKRTSLRLSRSLTLSAGVRRTKQKLGMNKKTKEDRNNQAGISSFNCLPKKGNKIRCNARVLLNSYFILLRYTCTPIPCCIIYTETYICA